MAKNSKKSKQFKILYTIAMVVLICVFLACAIYLFVYYYQAKRNEDKVDELKELFVEGDNDTNQYENEVIATMSDGEMVEFVRINGNTVLKRFSRIYRRNMDFIGWLKIEDTEIDYPVMLCKEDEEYYLHRDFDKKYNGNGTLFMDTESDPKKPSDNLLIYGHNMKNGKMFNNLLDYRKEDFYKKHKYIQFDTLYSKGIYEVVAAFPTKIYEEDYEGFKYYTFFNASNEKQFNIYIDSCKELTPYTIETTASYGDELITLSTCAYHADEGRFVVVAKKISNKDNLEDIKNKK